MRLFDVQWPNVLPNLARWRRLSVPARASLLNTLKLTGYTSAAAFGVHIDEVVLSGIAIYEPDRQRLMLDESHRELLKVLRAMGRHQLFEDPDPGALRRYLEEHFTHDEANVLGGNPARFAYNTVSKQVLANLASSSGWPGDLLAAATDEELLAWAAARGERDHDHTLLDTLRRLRWIVQALVAANETASVYDWYNATPEAEREPFARAVHLGLRTLVLFAAMRGSDLEPMVGVWPAAANELRRAPATAPVAVTPVEQFGAALLMEDMTALLASVVSAPVRLRTNDLHVFARTRSEIESRLIVLPHWAQPLYAGFEESRVDRAARMLLSREFAAVEARHLNPHLAGTAEGEQWLSMSSHDRLQFLLEPMREAAERNPRLGYLLPGSVDFFPFTLPYFGEVKGLDLRGALTSLFLELGDGFYSVDAFLDYAAREANPWLALPRDAMQALYRQLHREYGDARDAFRSLWHAAVRNFLSARLTVYGGVTLGVLENGTLCFALTDIGRYLLGASEQFAYGNTVAADIIVQPDFDVVLLAASPVLEALLARAAERIGEAPGVAFKLTRASVIRAAESGMNADDVLSMLRSASSKPLPQNVQREVLGWMSYVRRAQLRTVEVVDAGDEETADRVVALLGNKAVRLTGTLVELSSSTGSARAALLKKLKAGGVLLDDQTGKPAPSSRGRRWQG